MEVTYIDWHTIKSVNYQKLDKIKPVGENPLTLRYEELELYLDILKCDWINKKALGQLCAIWEN